MASVNTASGRKGLSLHVGLNEIDRVHYGTDGALNACISDAEAMRDLAKAGGFQVMSVLTNSQGTRAAVKAGIEEAAKKLKSGDIFLYTYSGHGSQTPDLNKDETEQGDNLDETWCLYDGMLVDDEAYELWKNFAAGVRVLVLLDCCHSGTAIKAAPDLFGPAALANRPKPRVLTLSQAVKTFKNNETFYKTVQSEAAAVSAANANKQIKCSVRLISGCQDNQLSMDGFMNGAFTEQLLKAWGGGTFAGNYADFHRRITLGLPPTQSPNHFKTGMADAAYDAQTPFAI
jgi:metacaspase-1